MTPVITKRLSASKAGQCPFDEFFESMYVISLLEKLSSSVWVQNVFSFQLGIIIHQKSLQFDIISRGSAITRPAKFQNAAANLLARSGERVSDYLFS